MDKNQIFPSTVREARECEEKSLPKENKSRAFPSRLRALRKESGLSQNELSKLIGTTKATVSLYEQGDSIPDAKRVYAIANAYRVSADYVLCLSDVRSPNAEIEGICRRTGLSEKAVGTLIRMKSLDPAVLKTVDALLCNEAERYKGDALLAENRMLSAISVFFKKEILLNQTYSLTPNFIVDSAFIRDGLSMMLIREIEKMVEKMKGGQTEEA